MAGVSLISGDLREGRSAVRCKRRFSISSDRRLQARRTRAIRWSAWNGFVVLCTRGVAGDNESTTALNGPADRAFAPNCDIFVADDESANTRIVKYGKDGRFLMKWGTKGAGPGQLQTPHSIVIDARGLYVANRGNKRVEIFDQNGGFLGQITNAATPYGLAISPDGILHVADGAAGSEGMTVVDTGNGQVLAHFSGVTGAHMVAVDRRGAIYVAEVRGRAVEKFVRK